MPPTSNAPIQLSSCNSKRNFYAKSIMALSTCLVFTLSACSTLPKQQLITPEYAYDIDTSDTSLAKIITPLKNQNLELTGYHILYEPLEAIAARIHLIDKAEKTLDLQYYIWDNDKIGALALYKIIQAADFLMEL